jgi:hypothetical protein
MIGRAPPADTVALTAGLQGDGRHRPQHWSFDTSPPPASASHFTWPSSDNSPNRGACADCWWLAADDAASRLAKNSWPAALDFRDASVIDSLSLVSGNTPSERRPSHTANRALFDFSWLSSAHRIENRSSLMPCFAFPSQWPAFAVFKALEAAELCGRSPTCGGDSRERAVPGDVDTQSYSTVPRQSLMCSCASCR